MIPALIGGPYSPPAGYKPGSHATCKMRGYVEIGELSQAPIPWPLIRCKKPIPILCGDLVKAVETEAATAIAYHWGVSADGTVKRWRSCLGVGRFTAGTKALWTGAKARRKPGSRPPPKPEEPAAKPGLPSFARLIQSAMTAKRVTAAQLASATGEQESTISRILTGATPWPRLDTAIRICASLKIPTGAMLDLL